MASSQADARTVVRLRVLDTDIVVHVTDAGVERAVRHLFAPFTVPTAPPDDAARAVTADAGLSAVAAEVNALALAGVGCLAVHAGAVASGGSVVAFPAASGAGKTTLTAACLLAGLAYVSDEALCLDWTDGSVRPYPRPLALSPWSAAAVGLPVTPAGSADGSTVAPLGSAEVAPAGVGPADAEVLVTAADLGAPVAAGPLRTAHVVLLDRPGGPAGLRQETRSAGVAELLLRSFTHWHHPERAFELVHEALADASVWRLSPSVPTADAATIAALLR